jgi:hypothetical protein
MDEMHGLKDLRHQGRMRWTGTEQGWLGPPDEIVAALAGDGYQEVKREEARTGRERHLTGGVWQGLNASNGSVAAAVWVTRQPTDQSLVFIAIDGRPVTGA